MDTIRYVKECADYLLKFDKYAQQNGNNLVYNLDGANKIGKRIHDLLNKLDIDSKLYVCHHDCIFVISDKSLNELSSLLYIGIGLDENIDKVLELYKKAVILGNVDAMYHLARLYEFETFGTDELNDLNEAVKLYNQAIKLGHVPSIFDLAHMYETGKHPDGKNIIKAIELYKKGSNLKCKDCIESLGRLFGTSAL